MKFKEYNQEQPWLIPPDIEDEIPPNDICRVINDVVDQIDLSIIEGKYKEEGNPAFHPRMMLKSLCYSYAQGIFSSRKIAREHERNIYYWYISGNQRPDFRTICFFRTRHREELKVVLNEITKICLRLGMIDFSKVAIDGTKIKANANKEKFRDSEWIERKIHEESKFIDEALEEAERIDKEEDRKYGSDKRGDEIPQDIIDRRKRLEKIKKIKDELEKTKQKRIHETDTEAKLMKSQGRFIPAYNCQVVADEKNQVILMANVINEENDWYQIKPHMEELKQAFSRKPGILLGDAGYNDGESLEYLKKENIEGIIPDKRPKDIKSEIDGTIAEDNKYKKNQFIYDKEKDVYSCPQGNELQRVTRKYAIANRRRGNSVRYHIYQCMHSRNCEHSSQCCRSKSSRRIIRYEDELLREEMAAKIRSPRGWELYKSRLKIIEPIFGNIKHNLGFDRFSLRGLAKTRGEFYIIAAVHNILKIQKYLKRDNKLNLKLAFNSL